MRGRARSVMIGLVVLTAVAAVHPAAADRGSTSAGPRCSFDGSVVTATFATPGGRFGITASLYQDASAGGELFFKQKRAIDCGATIADTSKVIVIGTASLDFFTVDESQRDFAGSLPPIDAQLGGGNDVLTGRGIPNQVNMVTVGTDAMVINGTVVVHSALARAALFGGNVDGDVLSGRGGGAAGGVFRQVMLIVAGTGASTLLGGDGPDKMTGGSGDRGDLIVGGASGDSIQGSNGDDVIEGGAGGDVISGSGGDDLIRGLGGDDDLTGDGGSDRFLGGPGDDTINAGDGLSDVVDGGRDATNGDTAYVDCGTDQVSKIEFVRCV